MTPEEMKVYQHNYWLGILADETRHAELLKKRKQYYKIKKLRESRNK